MLKNIEFGCFFCLCKNRQKWQKMAILRLKMAKNGNKNLKPAEHFFIDISINLHFHILTKFFLPLVTVIPAQTMTSPLHVE